MLMVEKPRTLLSRYAETQDPDLADALVGEAWPIAYRVCRKALGDVQRAEDAAQEAVIRLLERADRFEANRRFAPWVVALAANAARENARAHQRRVRREQRAARPDEYVGAGYDRLELDEIRAVVEGLPAEIREPVVLHYYGGLTFRQVAAATGVSEGTAASRIRSGKLKLRKQLQDAGYSASSVTAGLGWLQADLQIEIPPAPPARALRGAPPLRPRLVSPLGGALAALLLVVGFAVYATRPSGQGLSAVADSARAAFAAVDSDTNFDPGRRANRAEAGRPATDPGEAGLVGDPPAEPAAPDAEGRVLVHVQLKGQPPFEQPWVVPFPESATADVDPSVKPLIDDLLRHVGRRGGRELSALHGGEVDAATGRFTLRLAPGRYRIVAGAEGHQTGLAQLTVGADEAHVSVPLPYVGVGQLRVEVADARGQLLPNQAFRFSLARPGQANRVVEQTTDAHGQVSFEVPAGVGELFATHAEAGRTSAASVHLDPGQTQTLRLRFMNERRAVKVRVLDREGRPVEGALVQVAPAIPEAFTQHLTELLRLPARGDFTRTAADGSAEFAELDTRWYGAAVVVARHETWGGRSKTVALDDPTRTHEISVTLDEPLERGHVRVRLFRGEGSESPVIRDDSWSFAYSLKGEGFTRYAGSYRAEDEGSDATRFHDLPAGALEVSFWGDGYAPHTASVEIVPGEMAEVELHLVHKAVGAKLQLFDADGEPFLGGLALIPEGFPTERVELNPSYRGKQGRFSVGGLRPDGRYRLLAWGAGYAPTLLGPIAPSPELQTLKLPAGTRRTLEFVGSDGKPVAGASLSVGGQTEWRTWNGRSSDVGRFVTDAEGRLELRTAQLPPEGLHVSISAHGYASGSMRVLPDGERVVRLILESRPGRSLFPMAGASLSGRVVDAQGSPLVGVAFQAIGPSGYGAGRRDRSRGDGGFRVKCESGRVVLRAYRGDFGLSAPLTVDLAKGDAAQDLEVVLKPGVRVSGHVRRAGLTGEERVGLRDADGLDWSRLGRKHSYGVQVDPSGRFDLGPLPPGTWQLVVHDRKRGAELFRQTVEVKAGAPLDVDLRVN